MTLAEMDSAAVGTVIESFGGAIRYQKQSDGSWLVVAARVTAYVGKRRSVMEFRLTCQLYRVIEELELIAEVWK